MRKIILFIALIVLVSCGKQIEEIIIEKKVEKIVEVPAQSKSQNVVAYYFEEEKAFTTDKKADERFTTIDWHNNELFLGVETPLDNNKKSYSVRKLDLQTGKLTEVISDLKEIEDLALSNTHIFVTQANAIHVFNRQTFEPQTIIGSGTHGYSGNGYGLFDALTLLPSDKYLFVRDLRRLLVYNQSDITAENSKKIAAPIKSSFSQRNKASLAQIENNLFLANGNTIEIYELNENQTIQNEQSAFRTMNVGTNVHQLAVFRGHLYGSFGEKGFARIDVEKGAIGQQFGHFQSIALNVTYFAFGSDKVFAVNNTNGSIATYAVKEIVYKEY